MDNEVRGLGQHVDFVDSHSQCSRYIRICRLIEAHMTVADLDKTEPTRTSAGRLLPEGLRTGDAGGANAPHHAGSCPCHTLEKSAAIDTVVLMIVNDCVFQNTLLHAIPVCGGLYSWSGEN